MAFHISWSLKAAFNLEDIYQYIAKDSKRYAAHFIKRINTVIKAIPEFPLSGRIVPEYDDENLREKIFKNYRIIYRIRLDSIEIVAIYHSAKLLNIIANN